MEKKYWKNVFQNDNNDYFGIVRLWVNKNQNKFYFSPRKEGLWVCFLVFVKKCHKYNIQINRGFVNLKR